MTNLEESSKVKTAQRSIERLENKYNELKESKASDLNSGYILGLDLAISFLKIDLNNWGEQNANK